MVKCSGYSVCGYGHVINDRVGVRDRSRGISFMREGKWRVFCARDAAACCQLASTLPVRQCASRAAAGLHRIVHDILRCIFMSTA